MHKGQGRGAPESQSKGSGLIKVHEIFETTCLKHPVSESSFYTSILTPKAQETLMRVSFPQRKGRLHWCILLSGLGKKPRSSKSFPCVSDH